MAGKTLYDPPLLSLGRGYVPPEEAARAADAFLSALPALIAWARGRQSRGQQTRGGVSGGESVSALVGYLAASDEAELRARSGGGGGGGGWRPVGTTTGPAGYILFCVIPPLPLPSETLVCRVEAFPHTRARRLKMS